MSTYTEVGEMTPDGTVGGDGAGDSMSRRWQRQREDGNWDLVTVYAYAVFGPDRGWGEEDEEKPWHAEMSTETLICRDPEEPGSTEEWSDTRYDSDVSAFAYDTEAQAKDIAVAALRRTEAP